METMSPLDALFLDVEDAVTHMHIGSVGIFEGPAPGPGEVQSAVAARLPQVPRYRQKVRFVPLALGRPAWVDDPHFNLEYHVRRTALPAPGGDQELRNLVGRVMSQQLDRAKPLWEMWVAEGLDDGRWAVISKVHHCMVDGVSGTDLMTVILSKDRHATAAIDDRWAPAPEPNSTALVTYALAQRAASPREGLRTALSAARGPRRVARQTIDTTRGLANLRTLLNRNPSSTLNGPIGPHRRWDWARARLVDIKQIRALHGGTINDAVLAAITGGFQSSCSVAARPSRDAFSAPSCPYQSAPMTRPGPTTTRSRRCSRNCRSDWRTPSSDCIPARPDAKSQAIRSSGRGRTPDSTQRVRPRDALSARRESRHTPATNQR